jgi:MFS family permease
MTTMVDMHELAYLGDAGFGKAQAAMIFAWVSLVQSLGTFSGGALSDRIGRENSYTIGALCLIAGITSLLAIQNSSPGFRLALFVFCYGLGNGFISALIPSITADVFHGNRVGSIYGTFATAITFGGGFSPWLAGTLFDRNGNYFLPFLIAMISVGSACLLIWLAAPRKFRR